MPQQIDPELKAVLLSSIFRPAITLWNRLEGRPRQEDFDRSLSAEIRDPLWMLTRQWQFGEFKGEDTGSAVKARVQLNTSRIDRYAVKKESRNATGGEQWHDAVPYDLELPLETEVEREPLLPETSDPNNADLTLRSQLGRHWMRLLKQSGLQGRKADFLNRFPFVDVTEKLDPTETEQLAQAHLQTDPASWQALRAVIGRLPDGRALLRDIGNGDFDIWVEATFAADLHQPLKDLGQDFMHSFSRIYSQPQTDVENAWAPSYLEYQFSVSAPEDASGDRHTILVAEQYHQGHLDWYAFDIDRQNRLADLSGASFAASSFAIGQPLAFLPTQIEFNGMPNVRWWEFEDRRTDFGSIRTGTADIPLLMLAEFGLIYGNDWSVLPYNLAVGTLADTHGIVVTDVFGVRTLIRAAGQGQDMDGQKWSMYNLQSLSRRDPVDHRLFLPPALAKIQESDPIEQVIIARDEMANMVWGIEDRIPGISGKGIDGRTSASALTHYFVSQFPQNGTDVEENEATIRYVLGTRVPENWIPFIARRRIDSKRLIRWQRAAMPRLTDAIVDSVVEPRGSLLRVGLDGVDRDPYFIHQEMPRAGVIVSRSLQRTRWFDGKIYIWMGRRKQTGRGEGASGLEFDQITPVEEN
jgi:hypothetical protein